MPSDLAIIVPTRGRPDNIRKVISAWDFTNAWDVADLVLAVDADDPEIEGYRKIVTEFNDEAPDGSTALALIEVATWVPMVHKLDDAARFLVRSGRYFAVGFAGDDHLPRTINWAKTYLAALRELGSGMVYGDDGYQGEKLSSEWAMTTDIVAAWGRMVPAPVEHMYCDQALLEVMSDAGATRYLPHIQIEHMHPFAKKAPTDDQYDRVNGSPQFARDKAGYTAWVASSLRHEQRAAVKKLRADRPEERPERVGRRIAKRREASRMSRRSPFPQFFRQVKNVTPEEIGLSLADLASQVPGHEAVVELGVYHGASALRLAWGARQGGNAHTWAVDPWDSEGNVYGDTMGDLGSARRWARHWITSLGYSNDITLIQRFSHEVAADWTQDQPRVGLLFVDGDHTYDGARRDIESWAPHLAEGGIIAVDDYVNENYPGVRQAVDALVDEGLLAPVEVYHDRMGVTRLAGKDEGGASEPVSRVTAITSEGAAIEMPTTSLTVGREDADVALSMVPAEPDPVMAGPMISPNRVTADEATTLQVSPGTVIETLTLPQLRALAKARQIVLGIRKDKKADTIQAILDGR